MALVFAFSLCLALQTVDAGRGVTLRNGDRVTVLKISDDLQRHAWTPLGKPISFDRTNSLAIEALGQKNQPQPNPGNELSVVAQITRRNASGSPSVAFRLGGSNEILRADVEEQKPMNWTATVWKSLHTTSTLVSVGVSEGKWATVSRCRYRRGELRQMRGLDIHPQVNVGLRSGGRNLNPRDLTSVRVGGEDFGMQVRVVLPSWIDRTSFQLKAYDSEGRELSSRGWKFAGGSRLPTTYWFNETSKHLARIELQTRPYEWATFRGVKLKPN